MSTPTAAWDLPTLVGSLRRADARVLPKGQLNVLSALVELLPYGSGEGRSTYVDVARAAGLHPDYCRKVLNQLEDRGLITWRRGYAVLGEGRPGFFRVCKVALVALINAARKRPERDDTRHAATAKTRAEHHRTNRIVLTTKPKPRKPLPDILSALHSKGGDSPKGLSPSQPINTERRATMSEKLATVIPLFGQRGLVPGRGKGSNNRPTAPADQPHVDAFKKLARMSTNYVRPSSRPTHDADGNELDWKHCSVCFRDEITCRKVQDATGHDHNFAPTTRKSRR